MPRNALSAAAKAALLLALTLVGTPATAQTYTARDLGTLPGADVSYATDVNDRGEVIGGSLWHDYTKNAFYWSAATGMVDIGMPIDGSSRLNGLGHVLMDPFHVWRYGENGNLPAALVGIRAGGPVWASDINDNGEICGSSGSSDVIGYDGSGNPRYATVPTIWKQVAGQWTPSAIPLPEGDNRGSIAQLTNLAQDGSGQAIGLCDHVDYDAAGNGSMTIKHVVRWTRVGDAWAVSTVGQNVGASGPSFMPGLMNAAGDAVGADPNLGEVLAERGTCTLLPVGVVAHGIDEAGNLAGTATFPEGVRAARRDYVSGGVLSLGTLGGSLSRAEDQTGCDSGHVMNGAGSIVGYSLTAGDKANHAFVWTGATGMRDLDSSSVTTNKGGFVTLKRATAINAAGSIVGAGVAKRGLYTHAFLLTQR